MTPGKNVVIDLRLVRDATGEVLEIAGSDFEFDRHSAIATTMKGKCAGRAIRPSELGPFMATIAAENMLPSPPTYSLSYRLRFTSPEGERVDQAYTFTGARVVLTAHPRPDDEGLRDRIAFSFEARGGYAPDKPKRRHLAAVPDAKYDAIPQGVVSTYHANAESVIVQRGVPVGRIATPNQKHALFRFEFESDVQPGNMLLSPPYIAHPGRVPDGWKLDVLDETGLCILHRIAAVGEPRAWWLPVPGDTPLSGDGAPVSLEVAIVMPPATWHGEGSGDS